MYDKRIVRGSTHAAMVIPAGTYPDNLFGNASAKKKGTGKGTAKVRTNKLIQIF